jgi:magnesium transporter
VLLEVDDWVRESLIQAMDRQDLVAATESMDADELADIAPDLPADVVAEVQKGLTEEERARLIEAMGYPDDSVGGIMDFEMVRVREDVSLEVVLRYLRRLPALPDHTDQVFVVNRTDKLLGILSLSSLLVNEPETQVSEVMSTDYLSLGPLDSDAEAAGAFERYDLVSAPVVDELGRLIGRVTIAEVVDVIREDSDEQALSRAGMQDEDIFAPVSRALRNRAPWLLFNLCTAATASFVASRFEDTVSTIVVLAFLMSIVAGIGGNSGNQTMTLIIRALAVGRITDKNVWQLFRRELLVTFMVGVVGSAIAAVFAWVISGSIAIALVMMAAMICNMLIGAMIGVLVPIVRTRFGKDPAMGSSVLLTFATDSLGFFIFLGLATVFLL